MYVGQTRLPKRRWADHQYAARTGVDTYFYNAVRKHGVEGFTYEVIEECLLGQADDREIFWIRKYKSNTKEGGYNTSIGGTNGNNSTPEHVREKISKAKKGVPIGPCPPEKAEKIRIAKLNSGYRHSDATRTKISSNRKITELTDEWKANISKGLLRSAKYKLSTEQQEEALSMIRNGVSHKDVATAFSVSRKTIWRVANGTYGIKRKTLKGEYQC